MKILKLSLLILIVASCQTENNPTEHTNYLNIDPPEYLREPLSNAGTSLLTDNDSSIVFIYRKGDYDYGGFTDTVFYRRTRNEGRTWTDDKVLTVTPGNPAQCFSTISPESGEVILFYIERGVGIRAARSENHWKTGHFS